MRDGLVVIAIVLFLAAILSLTYDFIYDRRTK
jgi:hypothetical protein